jgi:hypothetical protein
MTILSLHFDLEDLSNKLFEVLPKDVDHSLLAKRVCGTVGTEFALRALLQASTPAKVSEYLASATCLGIAAFGNVPNVEFAATAILLLTAICSRKSKNPEDFSFDWTMHLNANTTYFGEMDFFARAIHCIAIDIHLAALVTIWLDSLRGAV